MYYSVFIADQDLSHVVGDDDEAYDYKFVKWMVKEKVDWVYLLLLPTMYITYLFYCSYIHFAPIVLFF